MKIGMMSFAHMHAYSYANCLMTLPDVEIGGIFDDDPDRGKKMAADFKTTYYSDQTDFLASDIDAVIICSENNRHKDMVIAAAKANKHILCEKPIATTVADAKEMIRVCQEADVIFQIAYPVRFSAPIRALKTRIDAGELGDIVAFRTTNRGQNPDGWFIDAAQSGGGAVIDHTVHMVDIMRWYSGQEVTEVDAVVDSYFHNIAVDDAGIMTLEFANGIIASHDASWSRFPEYPAWGDVVIEVIGTKQTVKVNVSNEHLRHFTRGEKSLSHVFVGNNKDFDLIVDFIDCVTSGARPSITGFDGLKSLEVALAAYESNRLGKKIQL
ncbi:Gfo/Idh/MocA family protein [Lentibacillus saliphilus]|uniref:Gfo/Idh/MocA family protein n=1 Tax=Lentibacillus saliphilus TaxID=2737028 RepID=UPI001C30642C|nr:Gfo/Idh/MocA family oxidoreductase [Lentibacillus saliphilus]